MDKGIYVYILSNKRNGTLYVGVTNDIVRRVYEHRSGKKKSSFSFRYGLIRLVYYEFHLDPGVGIRREKLIKGWKRKWKIELIEQVNPKWADLSEDWYS